jgi:hypothetical protein
VGSVLLAPTPRENTEFAITESPRVGKIALARRLGQPFGENTVATWLDRGRRYLTGAREMEKLNASWDVALADQDVELLGRLLVQTESIFNGGMYDVEAVFR